MLNLLATIFSTLLSLLPLFIICWLATALADFIAKKILQIPTPVIPAKYEYTDEKGNVVRISIQNSNSEKLSEIKRGIEAALEEQGYEESEREDKKRFA